MFYWCTSLIEWKVAISESLIEWFTNSDSLIKQNQCINRGNLQINSLIESFRSSESELKEILWVRSPFEILCVYCQHWEI